MNSCSDAVMLSRWSPISVDKSWRYRCTAGYLNWPEMSGSAEEWSCWSIAHHLHMRASKTTSTTTLQGSSLCRCKQIYEKQTFKSPSSDRIDELTASSVNSGNSFKQSKNVITSVANNRSCSGKSSRSISSKAALTIWVDAPASRDLFLSCRTAGLTGSDRSSAVIFRGNKSAAFSRNRKIICARRSRRWKAEERIPTELPSWRAALAKLRSYSGSMRVKRALHS